MKFKPCLYGRVNENGEMPITIRLAHNSKSVNISTPYRIVAKYFNAKEGLVRQSHPKHTEINAYIAEKLAEYTKAVSILGDFIHTVDCLALKNLILKQINSNQLIPLVGQGDFYDMAIRYIEDHRNDGKKGNSYADNVSATLSRIKQFWGEKRDLSFSDIDYKWLKAFKDWYVPEHGKPVSFYTKASHIRSIFIEASRRRIISKDLNPFDSFPIQAGYDATIRQIGADALARIYVEDDPARDMFFLSFFFCGMNMKDIVNIPYTEDDYITVERCKVKDRVQASGRCKLRLFIQPETRAIIDKYPDPEKKFLIKPPFSEIRDHTTINKISTKGLKAIANCVGLDDDLCEDISIIYARHSFGTLAGKLRVPDNVIDKALMHSVPGIIEKYREFDYSIVDEALRKVIDSLLAELPQASEKKRLREMRCTEQSIIENEKKRAKQRQVKTSWQREYRAKLRALQNIA